jgi:hypothetical protein
MIDFDVVTGPSPAEKPREPAPKPAARPPGADIAARLPGETAAPARAATEPSKRDAG